MPCVRKLVGFTKVSLSSLPPRLPASNNESLVSVDVVSARISEKKKREVYGIEEKKIELRENAIVPLKIISEQSRRRIQNP